MAANVSIKSIIEITGKEPLDLAIELNTAWQTSVKIGDIPARKSNTDYKYINNQYFTVSLEPGLHEIVYDFSYKPKAGGFSSNYSYIEADGWRERNFIGVDSERVKFHLPESRDLL